MYIRTFQGKNYSCTLYKCNAITQVPYTCKKAHVSVLLGGPMPLDFPSCTHRVRVLVYEVRFPVNVTGVEAGVSGTP